MAAEKRVSLAHYFTFFRILISPFFPLLCIKPEWFAASAAAVPYLMLFLLILSESSDIFDGFFARRRNEVTDLGKVLDPMADAITHISLFFSFTQSLVQLPMLLVFVFFYREFLIMTLRTACALKGYALAARISGKIKTVLQAITVFLILFLWIFHDLGLVSLESAKDTCFIVVLCVAGYTVFSAIDYLYANRSLFIRTLLE